MASKTKKDPDAIYSTRATVKLRKFLLDEYTWKGKQKLVSYLFSNNFQNRLRASAHAGNEGNNFKCPYCDGTGLEISKEAYKNLENELAKFGEIRIPEVIEKSLGAILGIDSVTAQSMLSEFKGYTLLGILYHSSKSKLSEIYGLRSKIRKKTEANYKQIVNGVDVTALTYSDIKDDVEKVSKLYKKLIVPCPACLSFSYLDVGHKDPQGKVVRMLQILYAKYKKDPEKEMRISDIWQEYHDSLTIFPQIAKRPTSEWAGSEKNRVAFASASIDAETGELTMANRFDGFVNTIKAAIKAELARIRSLIEKNEIASDPDAITFEEAINLYAKLIRFSRVSTGTLKKKLKDELRRLLERFAQARDDDTLKIMRNGKIVHVLPERFLWIQGATQKERRESGVAKVWRTKKGKRVLVNLNPKKSKESTKQYNRFRIYGAFLSDDDKFGYDAYSWGKGGQKISDLLRSVGITGGQVKFVKVFPQILAD